MRVTVIDYKAGNLTSVMKALRHLGADVEVTDADLAPLRPLSASCFRRGPFCGTEYLDSTGLTPPSARNRTRVRSLASASACNGSTRDRPKHQVSPASPIFRAMRALF